MLQCSCRCWRLQEGDLDVVDEGVVRSKFEMNAAAIIIRGLIQSVSWQAN